METFAPEDILIDNLSFALNKGSSYITALHSGLLVQKFINLHRVIVYLNFLSTVKIIAGSTHKVYEYFSL